MSDKSIFKDFRYFYLVNRMSEPTSYWRKTFARSLALIRPPMFYQHEEEGDQEGHSSGHDLRLDQVGDPGDDDEHEAGQVDLHQVLHRLADQLNLEAARRVVA